MSNPQTIYQPGGPAAEYSPLALNVYAGGCAHGCTYCYNRDQAKRFGRPWGLTSTPRDMAGLAKAAAKAGRQVLLSFGCDPYCPEEDTRGATRAALLTLRNAGCSVALLTKAGAACLRDADVFRSWPGGRIQVGATLTFDSIAYEQWEPNAAPPSSRIHALAELHDDGVRTWASIEPVIDPAESLAVIRASLPYVDRYAVGKLNHDPRREAAIDWRAFGEHAVCLCRSRGRPVYVKQALRSFLPAGFLLPSECDPATLWVEDRP